MQTPVKYDFETLVDRSRMGSVKWGIMRQKDPDVSAGIVPLSIGDMELKSPPELVNGLEEYLRETVLGYTAPTAGTRNAVIDWFRRRHGWEIKPEWLAWMDGVVPALYLAVRALTAEDEGVIYMPPVYRPIYNAIHDNKRRVVEVPLAEGEAGYEMDFDALEAAVRDPKVTLLLFCSPHNPVGRVWRRDELKRMGELCLENGVLVVSDEIHMDFAMTGKKHTVFSEVDPRFAENCIICTAPSKTFNIAGLQNSQIVIPGKRIRERFLHGYHLTGRHGVNMLGLAACRLVYERCEGWFDAALELIEGNGQLVREFMGEHYPEVRVYPHEGTYFMWMDFRKWSVSKEDLERFMTRGAGLFMDEGYVFGEQGAGFERINLACPRWVLRDALERLLKAGRP